MYYSKCLFFRKEGSAWLARSGRFAWRARSGRSTGTQRWEGWAGLAGTARTARTTWTHTHTQLTQPTRGHSDRQLSEGRAGLHRPPGVQGGEGREGSGWRAGTLRAAGSAGRPGPTGTARPHRAQRWKGWTRTAGRVAGHSGIKKMLFFIHSAFW
jgi:hypothetical protein